MHNVILQQVKLNKYLLIAIFSPLLLIFFNNNNSINYYISSKTILLMIIISPIIEEMVFRYFLYNYLQRIYNYFNKNINIILTNIVFMLLHLRNTHDIIILFGIFISGIVFNLVYIEKKLLIYPILIHAWFNLCYLLMLY
jgi:membrane protease YdiL (CAAX protease family)